MLPAPLRPLARLAGMPAGWVVRNVASLREGPRTVLEVELSHLDDGESRARWLARLSRVASDAQVSGLLLTVNSSIGGWAATEDLRAVLATLRASGKQIYALLEGADTASMWVASAADKVWMVPTGELALVGVASELVFFGEVLERFGLKPDLEAAGAYKSFGEPFTRTFSSPENREATHALVHGLQGRVLADLAESRALTVEAVREMLAEAPLSAQEAKGRGLVDELGYHDELATAWEGTLGGKITWLSFHDWAQADALSEWTTEWGAEGAKVVVLHLDGSIVMDDEGGATRIRARTVVPLLKELYEDDDVKAVVLAVDSGGGSALASDLIWREVVRLGEKKPVVAAYADVTASGGVYLAAAAKRVFARRTTLTGSVGVFGGKLVVAQGLRQAGVQTELVAGGPHAGMFSPTRPFSETERARFRASIQRIYDGFVERVAEGRGVEVDVIEPYCRGRVWTGEDAIKTGLVDEIGGLDAAVSAAVGLAQLKPGRYRVVRESGQPKRSFAQRFAQQITKEANPFAQAGALASSLGPLAGLLDLALGRGRAEALGMLASHQGEALALSPWAITSSPKA